MLTVAIRVILNIIEVSDLGYNKIINLYVLIYLLQDMTWAIK